MCVYACAHTLLSKVGWGTVEEKAGWHKTVEGTEHQPTEFGLCLMSDGKPWEEQRGTVETVIESDPAVVVSLGGEET